MKHTGKEKYVKYTEQYFRGFQAVKIQQSARTAPKVMPSIIVFWLKAMKVDITGMIAEVEYSQLNYVIV